MFRRNTARRSGPTIRHLHRGFLVLVLITLVAFAGNQTVAAVTTPPPITCSNHGVPPKSAGHPVSIGGVYTWTLGTFYVRQVGTCVYLLAQSKADANGPAGKGFTSVFVGGIARDLTVRGLWSDVPFGQVTGAGTLVWKISQANGTVTLSIVHSTGGWGATQIVRTK